MRPRPLYKSHRPRRNRYAPETLLHNSKYIVHEFRVRVKGYFRAYSVGCPTCFPNDLFFHLKEHYTPAEAKVRIDAILEPYGENCKIEFRKKDAEIIDSYLVRSKTVRHLVC